MSENMPDSLPEAGTNGIFGAKPKDIVKDAADDNQASDKLGEMLNKLSNTSVGKIEWNNTEKKGKVTINEREVDRILGDYLKTNAANELGRELKANKTDGFAMLEADKGVPWRSFDEERGKKPPKGFLKAIGIRADSTVDDIIQQINTKFPTAPDYVKKRQNIEKWKQRLSTEAPEMQERGGTTTQEVSEAPEAASPQEIARCLLSEGGWRCYWWGWQHDVYKPCATNLADYLISVGIGILTTVITSIAAGTWIAAPVAILVAVLGVYFSVLGARIKYLLNTGSNGVILNGAWIPSVWANRR
jgi:hypothetical protein